MRWIASEGRHGLGFRELDLLVLLGQRGAESMRTLGEQLQLGRNAVQTVSNRLEARGLVLRLSNEGSRRSTHMAVTQAGLRLIEGVLREMIDAGDE